MINVTQPKAPSLLIPLVLIVIAAGVGFFMVAPDYDWQGMLIVTMAICVLAFFLLPRLARHPDSAIPVKVLAIGLLFKLGFAMLRNWSAFILYGGSADAAGYHKHGILISQNIWNLKFGELGSYFTWGTSFIELFTGVVYSVTGPSILAGYLVFAFIAFLGSYYFYRAFRIAFPDGNKWLYIALIFFFPSILYWPNGIGKDALIFFFLGLFAYGGARIVQGRLRGLLALAIGLVGTLYIRPHIAVIVALSLAVAFLLPGAGKRPFRIVSFIIMLAAVVAVAWLLLPQVASFIGVEELSPQGILDRFQFQSGQTAQGGSAFQAIDIKNPLSYPWGLVTLLFRPFPWEAHNAMALIQSLEGVLLIGLVLWRIKSLGKALVSSVSDRYSRFIVVYTIAFTIAFSIVANFGIIARERMMFLPFVFMFICFTPSQARSGNKALQKTMSPTPI